MRQYPAISVFVGLSILTCIIYPLAVTVIASVFFHAQSQGSLIVRDGRILGSELIGQPFSGPGFFWSRPSATAPYPYNAAAGAGSNLAASNPALLSRVSDDLARLMAAHEGKTPVPVDLVTASGSGLDPHISPAAAQYQVERVARARGIPVDRLRALVLRFTEPATLGLFGEARVNVLKLNIALEEEEQG